MEAFDIKIAYGTQEVSLTVLPAENNIYRLLYHGGILGAVCFDGRDWDRVTSDTLIYTDEYPRYMPGKVGERIEIELTDHVIDRIGWEIELEFFEEVA
ncbi:hypothetical protein [Pedobacter sp. JY14-1]|uniref:hypothetical protein n=1 Tax=Pedobacter sp. JY14-1 TaxID=3034151 RepID=UPI0023E091C7|nr:hypothetical protein [Pedobacter sp. JY14-1]